MTCFVAWTCAMLASVALLGESVVGGDWALGHRQWSMLFNWVAYHGPDWSVDGPVYQPAALEPWVTNTDISFVCLRAIRSYVAL